MKQTIPNPFSVLSSRCVDIWKKVGSWHPLNSTLACDEGNLKSHAIPDSNIYRRKCLISAYPSTSHYKMGLGILEDRVMEHVPGLCNTDCSLEITFDIDKRDDTVF